MNKELSTTNIFEEDIENILNECLNVECLVQYWDATASKPYKATDEIFIFKKIVGYFDDGNQLSIAIRNGCKIDLIHYSRIPHILTKINKLKKDRS